jgi:hypothetical protein
LGGEVLAEVQIDKLTVEIEADTANATKGLDRLKKAMDNLSSKKAVSETNLLGGAFSNLLNKAKSLISIVAISQTLGKAIAKYSEYVEDINLFSVAMGDFADKGAELADRMQGLLGVDSGQAMKNMALFQNLTTSFGVAGDRAYILSSNLTQLGYDLASFHNLSIEESFQKLQAAISGELEPIRRLGVDISNARLQQELYNLGINKNINSLSQADKAQLRYIAIMKQTTNAQMDMGRTLNTPANQMRILKSQVEQLAKAIGAVLIPAVNAILPPMIAVVKVVQTVISAIARLFGAQVKWADFKNEATAATGGASAGLNNVANSAAKAAKNTRDLIGGFDELNVAQDNSSSGSGSGDAGTGGSVLGGIDLSGYDMFGQLAESKVTEWVDRIKTAAQAVLPFIAGVGAAFLAWKIPELLPTVLGSIKDGAAKILELFGALNGAAGGAFQLAPVAAFAIAIGAIVGQFTNLMINSEAFREGLSRVFETLKEAASNFWEGLKEGLEPAKESIDELKEKLWGLIPESVQEKIVTFFEKTVPDAIKWMKDDFAKAKEELDLNFGDLITLLIGFGLLLVPGGQVAAMFVLGFEWLTMLVRKFGLVSDEQLEEIKSSVGAAFRWIGNFIGSIISAIVESFSDEFGWIAEFVASVASAIVESFSDEFNLLIGFLKGVFSTNWGEVFTGVANIAKNAIKVFVAFVKVAFLDNIMQILGKFKENALDVIKSVLNGGIDLINNFIGWLNSLKIEIPSFSIAGHKLWDAVTFDFIPNISELPHLASGGVLTSPTPVLAGEYANAQTNPEIVTPQSLMKATVLEANAESDREMLALMRQMLAQMQGSDTRIIIDGKEVFRVVKNQAQREQIRTGVPAF